MIIGSGKQAGGHREEPCRAHPKEQGEGGGAPQQDREGPPGPRGAPGGL